MHRTKHAQKLLTASVNWLSSPVIVSIVNTMMNLPYLLKPGLIPPLSITWKQWRISWKKWPMKSGIPLSFLKRVKMAERSKYICQI